MLCFPSQIDPSNYAGIFGVCKLFGSRSHAFPESIGYIAKDSQFWGTHHKVSRSNNIAQKTISKLSQKALWMINGTASLSSRAWFSTHSG